ncbi:MAG: hypothetical protein ACREP7_18280 [Lysobacter sp.]
MSVELHIDRIVLQDVAMTPLQLRMFQVALERQLSQLLSQQASGQDLQSSSQPRAQGAAVSLAPTPNPIGMAHAVAGSLAGCIGR